MHRNIIIALIVISSMIFVTGCNGQEQPRITTGLMKGQLAPDFSLRDINGKQFSLSTVKNKNPVCLVFWATWCVYCIKEIPKIKEIYSKFSGSGLKVISIDVATNDPIERVRSFQKQINIPYAILYDKDNIVSRLYGITGVPVSIVIDKQGIIQYRGYQFPENFEDLFNNIL